MTKIALQTFTIRNLIQTEEGLDITLKKLSDLGIKNLELAYIPWTESYIEILSKCLDKYDMNAISSQIKLDIIEANYEFLVKVHNQLDIKYMAISVIPFKNLLFGKKGIKKLAKRVNELGCKLKKDEIHLMFHHHNYEFIRFGRKTQFDYICEFFDPTFVTILSDTYWIRKGKYDVIEFLKKYKNNIKAVHLRGHLNGKDSNLLDTDNDFSEIISYIKEQGFYYGAIEQNTNDEFNEIKKSINYIKDKGFGSLLGGKDV